MVNLFKFCLKIYLVNHWSFLEVVIFGLIVFCFVLAVLDLVWPFWFSRVAVYIYVL